MYFHNVLPIVTRSTKGTTLGRIAYQVCWEDERKKLVYTVFMSFTHPWKAMWPDLAKLGGDEKVNRQALGVISVLAETATAR